MKRQKLFIRLLPFAKNRNAIFEVMESVALLMVEQKMVYSHFLKREVVMDFYLPKNIGQPSSLSLLLLNDGQDLPKMPFHKILDDLFAAGAVKPLLAVGIYAADRKMEYGTSSGADYAGRGAKAGAYTQFILAELLPFIHTTYHLQSFVQTGFAGFSLGGLMALDVVWHYPKVFSIAGVFSGSLWWRSKSLDDGYDEDTHRLMHAQIRKGCHQPGQRFYFTTGSLDETADRNNNGIIDSIDDTLGLVKILEGLGYNSGNDIRYINFEDGRHDVSTWARALPAFLMWGWGK